MKILKLSREYNRISRLSKEDALLFRKLLKGGCNRRRSRELLIMPIYPESDLICHGFAVEHHQLFSSKESGQYYLVFWPLKYKSSTYGAYPITRYCFMDSPHQDGYFYLTRCNDTYSNRLGGPYVIFEG